jgi:hypothetical protein
MAAQGTTAPAYAYALAVVLGLVTLPYTYSLALIFGDERGAGAEPWVWVFFWVACAAAHAALGTIFGLLWPGRTWRWGVWLCGAPLCAVSFLEPGAAFYAGSVSVSLLPACACAYAGGRYGLKQAAAGQTW